MNNRHNLGEESIGKLLVKYSIPAIISMLVTSLYNIADRAFIGGIKDVGTLSIAGLGITMPIFTLIVSFGVLIAMGSVTNISIKLGEGKKEEAEKYLGNGIIITVVLSAIITILATIYLNEILIIFGASNDTIFYAKEYISIIIYGTIFSLSGFVLNTVIRADGNPKMAAKTMIVGCILNLIFDPLFIYVFDLGIKGAAIGTVLCQIIICLWIISYFLRGKSNLKIRKSNLKLNLKVVKEILVLGLPPFLLEVSVSLVNVVFNNTLKSYGGDLAIGAMTAVTSISLIFMMPIFGINQGIQSIIGYNYGAKKYERAKKTLNLSIIAGTFIVALGFIASRLFPKELVGIFTKDPELIDIALKGMKIYLITLPTVGLSLIGPIYFQSIGKAKQSMFLSLLRQLILLLPLLILMPRKFGVIGVWIAQPFADIIAAFVILVFLRIEFRNKIKII